MHASAVAGVCSLWRSTALSADAEQCLSDRISWCLQGRLSFGKTQAMTVACEKAEVFVALWLLGETKAINLL